MSILSLTRTRDTYLSRFSSQSAGTLKIEKAVLSNFDNFVQAIYKKSEAKLFKDLLKYDIGTPRDNAVLDVLQNYANFLHQKGMTTRILKNYTRRLKSYFNYLLEIKLHSEDLKVIKYPKQIHEDRYPLKIEEIKKIMDSAGSRKGMYLFMLSAGMPIEETCRLRKRDFAFTDKRYMITVPASYRKVRRPKITFMSQEASEYVKSILDNIGIDDLVFGTNQDPKACTSTETSYFDRVRNNAGYGKLRYENSNHHKIGLHSFRAYFITKASKVDHDLAHALAGHNSARYMPEYDRYEIPDLLEFYIKAEKHLKIYGVTDETEINERVQEIQKQTEKTIQQLQIDLETQKAKTNNLEKAWKIMEKMDELKSIINNPQKNIHMKVSRKDIEDLANEMEKLNLDF